MFIVSAITYIIGIAVYFIFIDDIYNNYFFIASIFMMLFFLKYHPNFSHLKSYFLFVFCLGVLISFTSSSINNTYLLKENQNFEFIYATITKVEKSNYNNKQYLYLSDVIFTSINYADQKPENIKLKIIYNKESNFTAGDIIKATAVIFPTQKPVIPFGFNFQKNNILKGISGNGYIVGTIQVIKDKNLFVEESILSKLINSLITLKESFKNNIKKGIKESTPKDIAPFIIAISLGEYSFLPKEAMDSLRGSSLAHLISISGYHISVISAMLFFFIRYTLSFFTKISLNYDTKKISAFITICFLLFYIFILGNHTPALRATIMSIAFLGMLMIYHRAISFNSLFLAGIIILSITPYLIFSASFLLSFIATFALIYFCNLKIIKNLDSYSKMNLFSRFAFFIGFSVCLTLFIEISIFPLIAYYFGVIPINGVFANTLASPVFSFIIMPSLIIYFVTPIFIGKYFLIITSFGMDLVLKIANFFYKLDFSLVYADFFSGSLLVILLVSYLSALLLKNKYSFILLFIFVLFTCIYFLRPYPDIIIDSTGKTLAIKKGDNYFFSKYSDKFVKSLWFKNPKINLENTIESIDNANCYDFHCILNIKNKTISVSEFNKYFFEDCGNVDIIIITNRKNNSICSESLVIDQKFLEKKGSTKIYISSKITTYSVNDNYLSYFMKFILQYL